MISYRTVFYFLPNCFVKNTNMCFATTHSSFLQLNKASVYNVPCYPIFGSLHEATTRSLTSFQFLKLLLLRSILKNTLLCSPISLYLSITIFIRQPLLQTLTQLPKFQNNNPRTKNEVTNELFFLTSLLHSYTLVNLVACPFTDLPNFLVNTLKKFLRVITYFAISIKIFVDNK